MRKIHLLIAAAALLPISAQAADMPTKAPYERTATPESFFAGGYVGLEAGYGWNEIKATLLDDAKFDPSKFTFGGVAGYRWGRTIMFGLEVSGKYAGAKQTLFEEITGKLQYYGDVSAQLGLAINNGVLVYVLAGPSWANFQVNLGEVASTVNYFGGHVGGGIDIKAFSQNIVIGLHGKYHKWGNGTLLGVLDTKAENYEVVARLMYRFPPNTH